MLNIICGACGCWVNSAGECVLKEQLGQLCTSATFASKAVNAAQSEKKITSLFCPLYWESVAQML